MAEVVRGITQTVAPHMQMRSSASALSTNISPQQEAPRKSRKSVAFSGDDTMMDENGAISEAGPTDDSKTTAMKHTTSQDDAAVDEVTDMFAGMGKKKKKSSKTKSGDETTGTGVDGEDQTATGDFDATKKKKKKSTKPKPTESTDDTAIDSFEAKLAEPASKNHPLTGRQNPIASALPPRRYSNSTHPSIRRPRNRHRHLVPRLRHPPYHTNSSSPASTTNSINTTRTSSPPARAPTRSHPRSVSAKATRRRSSPTLRRYASA